MIRVQMMLRLIDAVHPVHQIMAGAAAWCLFERACSQAPVYMKSIVIGGSLFQEGRARFATCHVNLE